MNGAKIIIKTLDQSFPLNKIQPMAPVRWTIYIVSTAAGAFQIFSPALTRERYQRKISGGMRASPNQEYP
jgi:hypothetical protein